MKIDCQGILTELNFKAVRSSGSGGQHVNKVATKIELYFNINASIHLSETQKQILSNVFKNRISQSGNLVLSCGETRSQLRNKTIVTERFFNLLEQALKPQKKRKRTTIPNVVKQKRLRAKRQQAEKKESRRKPPLD